MKKVYAKHLPYKNGHYPKVYHEMTLSTDGPIIRALQTGPNEYCAVEGSHRIASAHSQGKIPRLIIVEPEDGTLPDDYWNSIKSKLPLYEFQSVFVMKETDFFETT